ncbi:hypothetical protein Tco_1501246 [Tanacetum coccineum]
MQPNSIGKSAQAKETVFLAGDTQVPQDLREDMGNTNELPVFKADPKDWFKKLERPPTPDLEWNEGKTVDNKPTQKWLNDLAKEERSSKTFDDLKTLTDQLDWNNPKGDRYPFDLSKPLPLNKLFNLKGEDIVHLAAALRIFTIRIVIQKRVEDLQLGVDSYQKKLNISKLRTHEEDLSRRAPYTTLLDPQEVIYEDKLNIKRLMRSD